MGTLGENHPQGTEPFTSQEPLGELPEWMHQAIVIPPEQHAQGFGDTNTKPAHSETPPEAFLNTLLQPRVLIIPVKRREQLTRNHSVALNYDTLQTWQESLTG